MPSITNLNMRYPTPPPTSHNLDSIQRAHVMRSTKKIGQVLGTTPHLVDTIHYPITLLPIGPRSHSPSPSTCSTGSSASDKSIKLSRRMGSIFTHSQASSVTSSITSLTLLQSSSSLDLPSSKKHSPYPHRPHPLVLHLNPVSLSPSDPRVTFPLTPSPTSGIFTPLAPTFNASLEEKQNAEARRRKMARVTRTLGQNVPPELVFPTKPRNQISSNSANRIRRSMSVSGTGSAPSAVGSWVGEWNRKDIKVIQKQLRDLKAR